MQLTIHIVLNMLISSVHVIGPVLHWNLFVFSGAEVIQPSSSVRNLGVILDPSIDMENHIKKICRSYSLRFCSDKLLQVPRSKLKSYGDRRFSIAGTKLWNSIPASLRNADSLNSLKKKHLKTYLFHQDFS